MLVSAVRANFTTHWFSLNATRGGTVSAHSAILDLVGSSREIDVVASPTEPAGVFDIKMAGGGPPPPLGCSLLQQSSQVRPRRSCWRWKHNRWKQSQAARTNGALKFQYRCLPCSWASAQAPTATSTCTAAAAATMPTERVHRLWTAALPLALSQRHLAGAQGARHGQPTPCLYTGL